MNLNLPSQTLHTDQDNEINLFIEKLKKEIEEGINLDYLNDTAIIIRLAVLNNIVKFNDDESWEQINKE